MSGGAPKYRSGFMQTKVVHTVADPKGNREQRRAARKLKVNTIPSPEHDPGVELR